MIIPNPEKERESTTNRKRQRQVEVIFLCSYLSKGSNPIPFPNHTVLFSCNCYVTNELIENMLFFYE